MYVPIDKQATKDAMLRDSYSAMRLDLSVGDAVHMGWFATLDSTYLIFSHFAKLYP